MGTGREWEARIGGELFELPTTLSESPQQRQAEGGGEGAELPPRRQGGGAGGVPLGRNRLLKRSRETGVRVRAVKADEWLAVMVADPAEDLVHSDLGYRLRLFPRVVPTPVPGVVPAAT